MSHDAIPFVLGCTERRGRWTVDFHCRYMLEHSHVSSRHYLETIVLSRWSKRLVAVNLIFRPTVLWIRYRHGSFARVLVEYKMPLFRCRPWRRFLLLHWNRLYRRVERNRYQIDSVLLGGSIIGQFRFFAKDGIEIGEKTFVSVDQTSLLLMCRAN